MKAARKSTRRGSVCTLTPLAMMAGKGERKIRSTLKPTLKRAAETHTERKEQRRKRTIRISEHLKYQRERERERERERAL